MEWARAGDPLRRPLAVLRLFFDDKTAAAWGRSRAPTGLLVCAFGALPPVPGQGNQPAYHVGGEPGGARNVPQRRVFMLGMPTVRRPHARLPAGKYPSARTRRPAE